MAFQGQIKAYLGWEWDDGAKDASNLSVNDTWADGVGVNQAEAVWHKEDVELLNAASTTYDLTALVRSVIGDTTHVTSLVSVNAILIVNQSTSGGELVIGGAAANEWSEPFGADGDKVKVPLDSPLLLGNRRCGWEVDDSNKNLKLLAQGGDVTYSIAIIGTINFTTGECSSSGIV
jgi:hypothetical protein